MEKKQCAVHAAREQLIDLWYRADAGEDKRILARCAGILTKICYRINPAEIYVKELELIADILGKNGSNLCATAFSLVKSLLSVNRDILLLHVMEKQCPAGICFKNSLPPCQRACPAGIDIPGFMAETGRGNYRKAVGIITEVNPFPYVCGMICPAPCENVCLRQCFDEPVFIRTMKAAAAKNAIDQQGGYPEVAKKPASEKRIAIVGSGPAGLSAAFFLAKQGHSPVVFESEKHPGGMLRYGIPDFRLPVDILERDISWIESSGVEIKTNQKIKGITELFNDGFDAVFLATGMPVSRKIPFKGNDLPHVISGIDFLRKINKKENPGIGSEVVVIGGGNVAVDVAMAALRQGACTVHMVCLENADEMPASSHELKTAMDEGILIHNSWGPFKATEDKIFEAVFCRRVFNESGKFSPEFDNEKKIRLRADNILIAAGQAADLSFLGEQSGVKTDRGLISVSENLYETDREGVFAGGDVVSGPGIAVEAIKSGKLAARAINAWLKKDPDKSVNKDPVKALFKQAAIISQSENSKGTNDDNTRDLISHMPQPLKVSSSLRSGKTRARLEQEKPEKRKSNYLPFESELDPQTAACEAGRCLRCDLCIGCGLCQFICSEMGIDAIRLARTSDDRFAFVDFTTIADKCISCGACAEVCPTGAMRIVQKDIVRKTEFTGTDMCEHSVMECAKCRKPVMPERYYEFIEKRISKHQTSNRDSLKLCQACTMLEIAAKTEKFH